jgi:DNA-binding CsgD family transcriptional regulator
MVGFHFCNLNKKITVCIFLTDDITLSGYTSMPKENKNRDLQGLNMTIYGKDCFFTYGIENILKEFCDEMKADASRDPLYVYVTAGMELQEIYSLFLSHPPEHYAIFIASERHFDVLNRLFPGLLKLCLPETLTVEELCQALRVMSLLSAQNQRLEYLPDTFNFTHAEHQIMRLSLHGHSVDDIARIRGVSSSTVNVQRNRLMKRMGTKSLRELCTLYSAMRVQ